MNAVLFPVNLLEPRRLKWSTLDEGSYSKRQLWAKCFRDRLRCDIEVGDSRNIRLTGILETVETFGVSKWGKYFPFIFFQSRHKYARRAFPYRRSCISPLFLFYISERVFGRTIAREKKKKIDTGAMCFC